jgi:hypothetical protein
MVISRVTLRAREQSWCRAKATRHQPVPAKPLSISIKASMTEKRTTGASDRNVVRDAKARPSHRTFYLPLAVLLILGIAVVGYAWQRGKGAGAAATVAADAPVTLTAGYVTANVFTAMG